MMKLSASNTSIIKRLLMGRNSRPLRSILNRLEPADIASLFSTLNRRDALLLFDALLSIDKAVDVLLEMPEQQLADLLHAIGNEKALRLLVYSSEDEAAYLLGTLDEETRETLIERLEAPKRNKIRQFLSYPEGSAGRLMETEVFSIPVNFTAAEGLEYLRHRAQELSIYYIYCVNEEGQLVGIISLRGLATAPAHTELRNIMKRDVVTVSPETSSEEVAKIVAHYDFIAVPVVDKDRKLLGIITVDDVVDIIQEQAMAKIYATAGLQADDRIFTPGHISFKNRLPWMLLNLFLAGLASSVVSLFEETMSQLIVLASLKNIVAGTGGNTAIQTLTVVTRGLATGDFSFITRGRAIAKEALVGLSMGLATGLAAGLLTFAWKGNVLVSVVICLSMMLNSLVAAIAGSCVPLILSRLKWDPATGSGVLVTTLTDIFGFLSFLGIATIGLRLVGP